MAGTVRPEPAPAPLLRRWRTMPLRLRPTTGARGRGGSGRLGCCCCCRRRGWGCCRAAVEEEAAAAGVGAAEAIASSCSVRRCHGLLAGGRPQSSAAPSPPPALCGSPPSPPRRGAERPRELPRAAARAAAACATAAAVGTAAGAGAGARAAAACATAAAVAGVRSLRRPLVAGGGVQLGRPRAVCRFCMRAERSASRCLSSASSSFPVRLRVAEGLRRPHLNPLRGPAPLFIVTGGLAVVPHLAVLVAEVVGGETLGRI